MTHRPARALLAVALLSALTACAGEDAPAVDGPVAAGVAPGATLMGEVGTKDQADAFEITLKDTTGANVTTLPAGDYTLKVMDYSSIHNFVLEGEGVDAGTDVRARGEMTFQISLQPGDYTFVCDPHPNMKGAVTVT